MSDEETNAGGEGSDAVVRGNAAGSAPEIPAGPHRLSADEAQAVGGADTGPSPYDPPLAALGPCTSTMVTFDAQRQGWPLEQVTSRLRHSKAYAADCVGRETKEGKTGRIEQEILLEGALTPDQRSTLREIANLCTSHRKLTSEIEIRTRDLTPVSISDRLA